jgi:hypothetical protein
VSQIQDTTRIYKQKRAEAAVGGCELKTLHPLVTKELGRRGQVATRHYSSVEPHLLLYNGNVSYWLYTTSSMSPGRTPITMVTHSSSKTPPDFTALQQLQN